jgi:hypothetical protein
VPRHSEQLRTYLNADDVRQALLGVIHAGGWNLRDEAPGEMQVVEYRAASMAQTAWKAKIRVHWHSAEGVGCDVHLDGRIAGFGPIQSRHLRGRLGAFRAAFEYEAQRLEPDRR